MSIFLYIMVDRYWRKIESVENDVENSLQIASILLKLEGHDEKINDISKIDTNKDNITSNLSEINNIKDDLTVNIKKDIFNETCSISNFSKNYNKYKIFELNLGKQFTNNRFIKINAKYNYL